MICVSISTLDQIGPVIDSGAQFLELRFDLMKVEPSVAYSKFTGAIKTIATCRPGVFSETERVALLKTSMDLGADFIDMEFESSTETVKAIRSHALKSNTELIISYHNFERTPGREKLAQILNQCFQKGGTIAKLATTVDSPADILNLLSLYDLEGRKVLIGMGIHGRITRVLAPYLGSEFSFASPDEGRMTAPGQLTFEHLKAIYTLME